MAYNAATVIAKDDPLPDGRVLLTVQFTGNAGESPMRAQRYVAPGDTALSLRQWAIATAASFGSVKTIADNIAVNQTFSLAPIAPTPPTAEDIWRAKVSRYSRLQGLGLTGQIATDLATLKADIEATYDQSYL